MATISELNRSTEEKLEQARISLKELNEKIYGSGDKARDNTNTRRRPNDLKRAISNNSHNSIIHNNNNRSFDESLDDEHLNVQIKSRVIDAGIQRREQVIAMQSRQNDLARNKRMFGSLLGTLQKFKKEENFLKTKEDKKAQILEKLEKQEMQEKIKLKQERDALIESRKKKQFEVKALETKMEKWKDLEIWEESHRHLVNFIKTSATPEIYWKPKVMDDKTTELRNKTEKEINDRISERRKQVADEVKAIEQQSAIENAIDGIKKSHSPVESQNGNKKENHDKGIKRKASSSSPETPKRMLSQVVIKTREYKVMVKKECKMDE